MADQLSRAKRIPGPHLIGISQVRLKPSYVRPVHGPYGVGIRPNGPRRSAQPGRSQSRLGPQRPLGGATWVRARDQRAERLSAAVTADEDAPHLFFRAVRAPSPCGVCGRGRALFHRRPEERGFFRRSSRPDTRKPSVPCYRPAKPRIVRTDRQSWTVRGFPD